jgi:hypothetical protein
MGGRHVGKSGFAERDLCGLEALLGEAVIHHPDIDAVDLIRPDAGMGECLT